MRGTEAVMDVDPQFLATRNMVASCVDVSANEPADFTVDDPFGDCNEGRQL